MRIFVGSLLSVVCAMAAVAGELRPQPVELPDYAAIRKVENYASSEEYEAARSDTKFRLSRVEYASGGLTVFAYLYAPAAPAVKLPVVVFNRGSWTWPAFAGEYLTTFHRLASAGFIVVAPMYRGSGGAEGRDELGGADVEDLMNTASLLREIPGADPERVFMYGESRGAMMTYQAIREKYPMRAAALYGGFTDMAPLTAPGGNYERAAVAIWPDYAEMKSEIDERRSALRWASQLDVPLLIMHGGADRDVAPSHALALASKLQELGKPYELVIRSGANHVLTQWRKERDAHAVEWFRRHLP
jgi:dipeptidyl aminopeptidase/acylaminoacyl peptidase